MKIAVATEEGKTVASHFGRSPYFMIFDVNENVVSGGILRANTFTQHARGECHDHNTRQHGDKEHHHGSGDHHSHEGVASGLKDCAAVISRGMGRRAWQDLRAKGIEMIVTDETDVEKAVRMYVAGELKDHVERLH